MKRISIILLLFFLPFWNCKESCDHDPDEMLFIIFDIVTNNGTSLLEKVYPAENVKIYNIDDTTKYVHYWKDPGATMLGIQFFSEEHDLPGYFDIRYGIKLNVQDTDTLTMKFEIGPIGKCEYSLYDLYIYYNNIQYQANTRTFYFQKK